MTALGRFNFASLRRALKRTSLAACLCALAACSVIELPPWNPFGTSPSAAVPAPALPTSQPDASVAVLDAGYIIGPEDAIDISVWKDDSLKASTLVRPDGGISFPLVGDLMAAGKTAAQLRDELTQKLEKFIPEPFVNVSVVRVSSYRFYVIGRVNKPGDFSVGRNVDVLQALSLAGGMTPFADEDAIRIIRKIDGKSVAIPFEYSRVRKGADLSQNITLRSGDVLLVP